MKTILRITILTTLLAILFTACGGKSGEPSASTNNGKVVSYSFVTAMMEGKMVFLGVGGDIDGQMNPTLKANPGDTVSITLTSGEGAEHNFAIPELKLSSEHVLGQGKSITFTFTADKSGTFTYICEIPGHQQAGMEGKFQVGDLAVSNAPVDSSAASNAPAGTTAVDIVRDPTDLPAPLTETAPTKRTLELEAIEVEGQLADGTTFTYWTFNGKVPGPLFRVRVGDTVEVIFKNSTTSTMMHSVDFHAVTGPGGGAVATQTEPGAKTTFSFKALNPGLYVYHCATPMVAHHMTNGMYGLILVEPEGGLPKVDREFYVMQGELYTTGKFGEQGKQTTDVDKLLNETPDYFVFNGAANALASDAHALRAKVGETIRIFFGVGGPNKISSFHVIGEIFDKAYNLAATNTPLENVQTVLVPPGGAAFMDFKLEVPGRYILVDHALSRLQRGLAGFLYVEGDSNPEIFNATPVPGSGH